MSIPDQAPIAVEAFCGAGGMSLGLREAGFRTVAAFDSNAKAIESYCQNLGPHGFVGDIREVHGDMILKRIGVQSHSISVVAGGPPCQGFSLQRREGEGEGDPRNSLPSEFLRLILELDPKFFLFENVPGIRGRHGEAILQAFMEDAANAGYFCHARVLDAVNYEVPQIRRRLFIVGERSVNGDTWFEFPPNITDAASATVQVGAALSGLPSPPHDLTEHQEYPHHRQTKMSALNLERMKAVPQGGGMEDLPPELRAKCHREGAAKIGHRYVYGRLHWERPASTITARFDSFTRGRFGHPLEDRNITLREGARLQTFPDDFRFAGNQEEVAAQIGNAVPPRLAKHLGVALIDAIDRIAKGQPPHRAGIAEARLFL